MKLLLVHNDTILCVFACVFKSEIVSKCQSVAAADVRSRYFTRLLSLLLFGGCDFISNTTFCHHVMSSFIVMNKEECALLMFSFNLLAYELPFDDVTHLF